MKISPGEILHEDAEYEWRQGGFLSSSERMTAGSVSFCRVWTWRLSVRGRFKR
jgi:hypothetical protein